MYGHTFAQALCKLRGDELRLMYVLCCDTAVQEVLVSKLRDWIKREPERFARQLEEKALAYRDWNDDELRLGILLELAKRAKLRGTTLTTAAELEEFAGDIVQRIEEDAAKDDRAYALYRDEHPDSGELEALLDYQIRSLTQALGRMLDAASQADWDEYMRRIEPLIRDLPELRENEVPAAEAEQARSLRAPEELPPGPLDQAETGGSDGWRFEAASPADRAPEFGPPPELAAAEELGGPSEGAAFAADEAAPHAASAPAPDEVGAEEPAAAQPAEPPRPGGAKLLLAALERQQGFAYYETAMTLVSSAEGLLGFGSLRELYGRRAGFLAASGSPAFLQMLPGGTASDPRALYRSLNPQRRRLPLLLAQLFLPELVSEDALEADYEPLLALWRARAAEYEELLNKIAEQDARIAYDERESASCAQQLETARSERSASQQRIADIRGALADKLRVSSMQLPHISESFDRLLAEYGDNQRRIGDAQSSRQERGQGFAGLVKYTLNYAASGVTLIDLRRKQERLLERMADEALRTDGEWGQGERYVVAAENERIGHLDSEIARLEKLQADYRGDLRLAEQVRKALEQDKKKLEKRVYGLSDLAVESASSESEPE
ncbi:hypothetical protein CDO73_17605 [Saccharibacillus sp. O23]|uniref:hypothetical protein n=1 Tax=Saccharibacillus sp. O23 TaxID=2009338 RepID=UPI000B4E4163|nr:hypothetical protein [Saccharibacillus sp. O23]OWR28714.1 hypothetical protein CDO73_17605 [Saccharibacillus sp. O23]